MVSLIHWLSILATKQNLLKRFSKLQSPGLHSQKFCRIALEWDPDTVVSVGLLFDYVVFNLILILIMLF